MHPKVLLQAQLPLKPLTSGQGYATYDLGDRLLLVATDQLSVLDVPLPDGIPFKGQVQTRLAEFWFKETASIIPNHFITADLSLYPATLSSHRDQLGGRSMLVKKTHRLNFTCLVRGYLAGAAWKEYHQGGAVAGIRLPAGLRKAEQLAEPLVTPLQHTADGQSLPTTLDEMKNHLGEDLGQALADTSREVYLFAAKLALDRGIIIADTKIAFGLLEHRLLVMDYLLTPDRSRYWAAGDYAPGQTPPSFEKQPVYDYLEQQGWHKTAPPPALPPAVIEASAERYREALHWLTGLEVRE